MHLEQAMARERARKGAWLKDPGFGGRKSSLGTGGKPSEILGYAHLKLLRTWVEGQNRPDN